MPASSLPSPQRSRIAAEPPAAESDAPVHSSPQTMPGQLRAESVRRAMRNEELKFCECYRNAPLRHAVRTLHSGTAAAQRGFSRRQPSTLEPLPLEIELQHQKKRLPIDRREKSDRAKPP